MGIYGFLKTAFNFTEARQIEKMVLHLSYLQWSMLVKFYSLISTYVKFFFGFSFDICNEIDLISISYILKLL